MFVEFVVFVFKETFDLKAEALAFKLWKASIAAFTFAVEGVCALKFVLAFGDVFDDVVVEDITVAFDFVLVFLVVEHFDVVFDVVFVS